MSVSPPSFEFLLSGLDTVECAYYLVSGEDCQLDYESLGYEKEALRQSKNREPKHITLGSVEFFLHPYGSSSGYPFLIENADFLIAFGEFNNPSFFVKFKSLALWHTGAHALHERFLYWTTAMGLLPYGVESLSRVDFSFDYQIPGIDFTEDDFVSLSKKDSRYRRDGKLQTLQLGKGDVVLRVYDKIAEIEEASNKTWFYSLWNCTENVWRIEWQVRKALLRRFGIRSFQDLQDRQGDVLRYLAEEHDSLRVPGADENRSRRARHPLWSDLLERIQALTGLGVYRELDQEKSLEERKLRIAISVYGYLKRLAAIDSFKRNMLGISCDEAMKYLYRKIKQVHDPISWEIDVEKKIQQIRLGQ